MAKEESKEVKKITVGLIFSWIFGVIFFITGIGIMASGSVISGIFILLFSAMIIPLFNKFIGNKLHFQISGGIKFLLAIVIVVLMIVAISHSSNKKSGTSTDDKTGTVGSLETPPQDNTPKTYAIGDSIPAGDFTWKITQFSTSKQIGQDVMGTFMGEKASGIFIIVDVEVENTGNEAKYLSDNDIKLVDEKGREFSANTMAAIYLKPDGSALAFEQVNPGIKKKGKIVFDVPEGLKVVNVKIKSTLFSSETYNIKLNI